MAHLPFVCLEMLIPKVDLLAKNRARTRHETVNKAVQAVGLPQSGVTGMTSTSTIAMFAIH